VLYNFHKNMLNVLLMKLKLWLHGNILKSHWGSLATKLDYTENNSYNLRYSIIIY